MTQKYQLGFVGAGNMASSLIGGLIAQGKDAQKIVVADAQEPQLNTVKSRFGVDTTLSNVDAARDTDTLVLAVKPNNMQIVCREIATALPPDSLVISVAAGVKVESIANWLGSNAPIVRCMPNTPALLSLGAAALYASPFCSADQRSTAEQLLACTGIVEWVEDEEQIDTVTALSGSGPAYFFYMIECMTQSAIDMGLSPDVAEALAIETAFGAASMARAREVSPATLRQNVTSPGGTTAAALNAFAENGFAQSIADAMQAAKTRAAELAEEMHASR